jgi:hypothetical protein
MPYHEGGSPSSIFPSSFATPLADMQVYLGVIGLVAIVTLLAGYVRPLRLGRGCSFVAQEFYRRSEEQRLKAVGAKLPQTFYQNVSRNPI